MLIDIFSLNLYVYKGIQAYPGKKILATSLLFRLTMYCYFAEALQYYKH